MDEKLNTLYHLGVSLYEAQEYAPAELCFKEAAELFHPAAQYWYARCLEWGLGVSANADEAFTWYERAAQLGDAQAQCRLGDACRKGERGEPDVQAAFGWYRRAAEQGYAPAMEYVGGMLINGDGVEKNETAGAEWLKRSAESGAA